MRRPLLLLAVLLAGLTLNACGNADKPASEGETEATYLQLGGLQYQVQVSRQLNPYDVEDKSYVQGAADASRPLGRDDTWFGVFVRVYNAQDQRHEPTSDFEITDTQGNTYTPVPLDDSNVFRYQPTPLQADAMIPTPGSIPYNSPIRGSLLLFRVKVSSFENRPLTLHIKQAGVPGEAEVPLDV
jgi:hypothetical protein